MPTYLLDEPCPRCGGQLADVTTAEDADAALLRGYCLRCRLAHAFDDPEPSMATVLRLTSDQRRRDESGVAYIHPERRHESGRLYHGRLARPWRAQPWSSWKRGRVYLGYFETRDEAVRAVLAWRASQN